MEPERNHIRECLSAGEKFNSLLDLGAAMTAEDEKDIIGRAKSLNPKIAVFRATRDAKGTITFNTVA